MSVEAIGRLTEPVRRAVTRLEAAAGFEVGFPTDFIAGTSAWVYGDAGQRVDATR